MITHKQLQEWMALILLLGMAISMLLVIIGGTIYLIHEGSNNIYSTVAENIHYNTNIKSILRHALTFSPLGIIELGLLTLVLTQVCRVGLLAIYYISIRDYKFICISGFILLVLIYSIFLQAGWR